MDLCSTNTNTSPMKSYSRWAESLGLSDRQYESTFVIYEE